MVSISEKCVATIPSRHWAQSALSILVLATIGAGCAGGGMGAGGSTSSGITYSGPNRWTMTGPQGGPFSNPAMNFLLDNAASDPMSWSATAVPSFVQLDRQSGVIPGNAQATVHGDLILAVAQALLPGTYTETLTFHNDSFAQPDIDIDCTLLVQTPGSSSQLLPPTDFASQGAAGGPFAPDSTLYTLVNTGSTPLNWQTNVADAWVATAPSSGLLAPGDSVGVSVSIDDAATSSLPLGLHQSVVEWRDAGSAAVLHSRTVSVDILAGQSSSGWTAFTPSADTRVVYVSSSTGNDGNNGLSQATPKRTMMAGAALLRSGFPDWLLLRCGDTFQGQLTDGGGRWEKNGRSISERMLVSSYGTGPRPVIDSGGGNGFFTPVGVGSVANNLALVGLDFFCSGNSGPAGATGLLVLGTTHNFLVEDCMTRNYSSAGIVFQGSGGNHQNVTIRRSVIVDTWTTTNFIGNGIYIEASDGVLIEENVIDSNGWTTAHPHGSDGPGHNMYIHNDNNGVVIRGNIVANTDGLQLRCGGTCTNNLFLRNAISFEMGAGTNPNPGGVSGVIDGNVILDGNDFPGNVSGGSGNRGWAYCLGNCVGVTMSNNIAAHNTTGSSPRPVVLNFQNNGNPNGLQDVTIDHNIVYDWGSIGSGAQMATYQSNIITNLTLSSNDIQDTVDSSFLATLNSTTPNLPSQIHASNNRWFGNTGNPNQVFQLAGVAMSFQTFATTIGDTTSTFGQVTYPDAARTIATYHASIGGAASLSAFIAEARQQSKTNWRTSYTAAVVNDYVRTGFGMAPMGLQ